MNGFIVIGIYKNGEIIYISNTSPVLWSNDIHYAKIYDLLRYAKNDLEDNFITLSASLSYTDIQSIWILEYNNDIEVGRYNFL